ncbi:MAG: hypothetical protein HOO96_44580 [Polyangiaceae bacterium]|nr:hypothetical protein [Polyangiaceae bacterium]
MERPAFAAQYPDDPSVAALVSAFQRGDYRAVRDGALELAKHEDPRVRAAADDLRERTTPDPAARWLLFVAAFLVLATVLYAVTRR